MAQIDTANQFMSLSTLANSICKASFQTKGINAFQDKTSCVVGVPFSSKTALEVREELLTYCYAV